ncbi:MAG: zinc finger domain-containing protein [Bacillota bacterium]|nr:zinc finger domain-containing protein [Bacillota bacterium]
MNNFKCNNCGMTLETEAATPPEICPFCQANCSMVDNNCYIPDCQEKED